MNPLPMKLDRFTTAYLVTALWSSVDDNGNPLDDKYSVKDFSAAALKQAVADCDDFYRKWGAVIRGAVEAGQVRYGPDFDAYEHAAHDFWLSRCGHGAGFFDGDYGDVGDTLQEAARRYGNLDIYEYRKKLHFI